MQEGEKIMARFSTANDRDLEELIPSYFQNKSELDDYKKICEQENSLIKIKMNELCTDKFETGVYVAKKVTQHRETINEEALLKLLKDTVIFLPDSVAPVAISGAIPGLIKTKEYIDMDVLEDAIYNGKIPEDVVASMASCKEVKDVETLKVTINKKVNSQEEK